jgi:hypothetical protein
MINVFFVPGMFGSTVEYVLRNFTVEHTPINAYICDDGSMHSFKKEAHFTNLKSANSILLKQDLKITTPIYPFNDAHLPAILDSYKNFIFDSSILLYADSLPSAELNILFQYYKIAKDKNRNLGLGIFSNSNSHDALQWNSNYTSWKDMKPWEWREWFSIFYVDWVLEWQISSQQVPESFLKIKNTSLLFDTEETFYKIIDFCKLTPKQGIGEFASRWQGFQQYIVDEFVLIDQIINHTIGNVDFSWNVLSIVSEAIIQQKLRSVGYELQCNDLDVFPNDTKSLYSLLIKC